MVVAPRNQRIKHLLKLLDLGQSWYLARRSELLLKPAAATWSWQSHPWGEEKHLLQMLLAIALQGLGPTRDLFIFVGQRGRDFGGAARRFFQQGKSGAQTGGRFVQLFVEFGQRGIFSGERLKDGRRVAQAGKNFGRKNLFVRQLPQPGAE